MLGLESKAFPEGTIAPNHNSNGSFVDNSNSMLSTCNVNWELLLSLLKKTSCSPPFAISILYLCKE